MLIELYRRLDERHKTAIERAVREAAPEVDDIARVVSAAYFACVREMPELAAVSAAVKGTPEMEAVQRELLDGYVELMAAALAPYSTLAPGALRLRCVGVLGAAEALAREDGGEAALTALIVGGIQ